MPAIAIALGVTGVILGSANLVNGIVGGVKTRKSLAELKAKLQQIQNGIENIQQSLHTVLSRLKWTQIIVVLADSVSLIDFQYNQMMQLDLEDKRAAKAWVTNLKTEDVLQALFTFHQVMIGQSPLQPGAFMKLFVDKLVPLTYNHLPQSKKWLAVDLLDEMVALQGKGYAVLLSAYQADGNTAGYETAKQDMEQRLETQTKVSANFIDAQSYSYRNIAWDSAYFHWYKHAPYVDTHEVVADPGKVVVGLQLYQKGNRIALKIAQATPEFDPLQESLATYTWKENRAWENEFFKLKGGCVDTDVNILPPGTVVTGAALYQKGKYLAIKLFETKIDPGTGMLTGPGKWQDSPGPCSNYFNANKVQYCADHTVIPPIPSCMCGAAIYQDKNRITIEIYTVYTRYSSAK